MRAFLFIADKRREGERRQMLADNALASRGDPKDIARRFRDE
jgi:hypothetical protein